MLQIDALVALHELAPAPKSAGGPRILFYKKRIENYIREHPGFSRSQINQALEHAVVTVRSIDHEWIERHMPESLSNKPRRHGDRNWNNRDKKLCALIAGYVSQNGPVPFRSFRDALIKLGQPKGLLLKTKGRLPNAHALLVSLIEPKQAAA